MVFNNTKVVPARLIFQRDTGAMIEIFCLEPADPEDYNLSFASVSTCVWKTIVGNRKKWKGEPIRLYLPDNHNTDLDSLNLRATLEDVSEGNILVRFSWEGGRPFSKVMEMCGRVPIPPYLHRNSESIDTERYQTLYASFRGSVAAPTAGLHFTGNVLDRLSDRGVDRENVCLHVGAGTFLPVKSDAIEGHTMHSEPFSISTDVLDRILQIKGNKPVVAVGTTSVRTLESLYWLGAECAIKGPEHWNPSPVEQWVPYTTELGKVPLKEALEALQAYARSRNLESITCRTRIIIVPTYRFRIVDWLITNFHQPKSTLLLLIAALIGEDWKKVYAYALGHGFRFLSYGDRRNEESPVPYSSRTDSCRSLCGYGLFHLQKC